MNIHIFILCYNEEVLLPHTIMHYKTYLPNCNITVYDNYSTDNSVNIAKKLGCNVILWKSEDAEYGDSIDDNMYIQIKNNCWKDISDGWIIVCDMDEWLCVTQKQLLIEQEIGTTFLSVIGYDIVSNSKKQDLSDINLHSLKEGIYHKPESKKMCFYRPKINETNYEFGAHVCYPEGYIQYSKNIYINKHMNWLGIDFITKRYQERHERIKNIPIGREGRAEHYTDDNTIMRKKHNWKLKCKKVIEKLE